MTLSTTHVALPKYVLLDTKKERLGPPMMESPAGLKCHSIFAFSDKTRYDLFCDKCEIALTPYPLVQGYLRNQIDNAEKSQSVGDSSQPPILNLIVLDPPSPDADAFQATTMAMVIAAQENRKAYVTVSHQLLLDPIGSVYRLVDVESDLIEPQTPSQAGTSLPG